MENRPSSNVQKMSRPESQLQQTDKNIVLFPPADTSRLIAWNQAVKKDFLPGNDQAKESINITITGSSAKDILHQTNLLGEKFTEMLVKTGNKLPELKEEKPPVTLFEKAKAKAQSVYNLLKSVTFSAGRGMRNDMLTDTSVVVMQERVALFYKAHGYMPTRLDEVMLVKPGKPKKVEGKEARQLYKEDKTAYKQEKSDQRRLAPQAYSEIVTEANNTENNLAEGFTALGELIEQNNHVAIELHNKIQTDILNGWITQLEQAQNISDNLEQQFQSELEQAKSPDERQKIFLSQELQRKLIIQKQYDQVSQQATLNTPRQLFSLFADIELSQEPGAQAVKDVLQASGLNRGVDAAQSIVNVAERVALNRGRTRTDSLNSLDAQIDQAGGNLSNTQQEAINIIFGHTGRTYSDAENAKWVEKHTYSLKSLKAKDLAYWGLRNARSVVALAGGTVLVLGLAHIVIPVAGSALLVAGTIAAAGALAGRLHKSGANIAEDIIKVDIKKAQGGSFINAPLSENSNNNAPWWAGVKVSPKQLGIKAGKGTIKQAAKIGREHQKSIIEAKATTHITSVDELWNGQEGVQLSVPELLNRVKTAENIGQLFGAIDFVARIEAGQNATENTGLRYFAEGQIQLAQLIGAKHELMKKIITRSYQLGFSDEQRAQVYSEYAKSQAQWEDILAQKVSADKAALTGHIRKRKIATFVAGVGAVGVGYGFAVRVLGYSAGGIAHLIETHDVAGTAAGIKGVGNLAESSLQSMPGMNLLHLQQPVIPVHVSSVAHVVRAPDTNGLPPVSQRDPLSLIMDPNKPKSGSPNIPTLPDIHSGSVDYNTVVHGLANKNIQNITKVKGIFYDKVNSQNNGIDFTSTKKINVMLVYPNGSQTPFEVYFADGKPDVSLDSQNDIITGYTADGNPILQHLGAGGLAKLMGLTQDEITKFDTVGGHGSEMIAGGPGMHLFNADYAFAHDDMHGNIIQYDMGHGLIEPPTTLDIGDLGFDATTTNPFGDVQLATGYKVVFDKSVVSTSATTPNSGWEILDPQGNVAGSNMVLKAGNMLEYTDAKGVTQDIPANATAGMFNKAEALAQFQLSHGVSAKVEVGNQDSGFTSTSSFSTGTDGDKNLTMVTISTPTQPSYVTTGANLDMFVYDSHDKVISMARGSDLSGVDMTDLTKIDASKTVTLDYPDGTTKVIGLREYLTAISGDKVAFGYEYTDPTTNGFSIWQMTNEMQGIKSVPNAAEQVFDLTSKFTKFDATTTNPFGDVQLATGYKVVFDKSVVSTSATTPNSGWEILDPQGNVAGSNMVLKAGNMLEYTDAKGVTQDIPANATAGMFNKAEALAQFQLSHGVSAKVEVGNQDSGFTSTSSFSTGTDGDKNLTMVTISTPTQPSYVTTGANLDMFVYDSHDKVISMARGSDLSGVDMTDLTKIDASKTVTLDYPDGTTKVIGLREYLTAISGDKVAFGYEYTDPTTNGFSIWQMTNEMQGIKSVPNAAEQVFDLTSKFTKFDATTTNPFGDVQLATGYKVVFDKSVVSTSATTPNSGWEILDPQGNVAGSNMVLKAGNMLEYTDAKGVTQDIPANATAGMFNKAEALAQFQLSHGVSAKVEVGNQDSGFTSTSSFSTGTDGDKNLTMVTISTPTQPSYVTTGANLDMFVYDSHDKVISMARGSDLSGVDMTDLTKIDASKTVTLDYPDGTTKVIGLREYLTAISGDKVAFGYEYTDPTTNGFSIWQMTNEMQGIKSVPNAAEQVFDLTSKFTKFDATTTNPFGDVQLATGYKVVFDKSVVSTSATTPNSGWEILDPQGNVAGSNMVLKAGNMLEYTDAKGVTQDIPANATAGMFNKAEALAQFQLSHGVSAKVEVGNQDSGFTSTSSFSTGTDGDKNLTMVTISTPTQPSYVTTGANLDMFVYDSHDKVISMARGSDLSGVDMTDLTKIDASKTVTLDYPDGTTKVIGLREYLTAISGDKVAFGYEYTDPTTNGFSIWQMTNEMQGIKSVPNAAEQVFDLTDTSKLPKSTATPTTVVTPTPTPTTVVTPTPTPTTVVTPTATPTTVVTPTPTPTTVVTPTPTPTTVVTPTPTPTTVVTPTPTPTTVVTPTPTPTTVVTPTPTPTTVVTPTPTPTTVVTPTPTPTTVVTPTPTPTTVVTPTATPTTVVTPTATPTTVVTPTPTPTTVVTPTATPTTGVTPTQYPIRGGGHPTLPPGGSGKPQTGEGPPSAGDIVKYSIGTGALGLGAFARATLQKSKNPVPVPGSPIIPSTARPFQKAMADVVASAGAGLVYPPLGVAGVVLTAADIANNIIRLKRKRSRQAVNQYVPPTGAPQIATTLPPIVAPPTTQGSQTTTQPTTFAVAPSVIPPIQGATPPRRANWPRRNAPVTSNTPPTLP